VIADDWYLVGAPWDSSGSGRGEQAAPLALRAGGLSALVPRDLGDAATVIDGTKRDLETRVLALPATIHAARALADTLGSALDTLPGRRPLVVGGDCSVLLGIVPALKRHVGPCGLVVLDGHPDYLDGPTSETGETADMALAVVTGVGPDALVTLAGPRPMLPPDNVVLLGYRAVGLDPASAAEVARLPPELHRLDAAHVGGDPAVAGRRAVAHLERRPVWVHLDLDVLDPRALPAVTYPQSGGLSWEQLGEVLAIVVRDLPILGVSVADFRPDLDETGEFARHVVELIERALP
jgi:arginase